MGINGGIGVYKHESFGVWDKGIRGGVIRGY